MVNNNNNKGVVVTITTTLPKVEFLSLFLNENYCNIIFLLAEKRYTYAKEIKSLLCIDPRYYIDKLVKLNIIENFELNKDDLNKLILLKNLNKMNIIQLTTYKLTEESKLLLQSPDIYKELIERCNIKIKKYVEHLGEIYNQKIQDIENKKNEEYDRIITRYNIAKRKALDCKTAEDLAIIDMIENGK